MTGEANGRYREFFVIVEFGNNESLVSLLYEAWTRQAANRWIRIAMLVTRKRMLR